MLEGFTLGQAISDRSGVVCFSAMRGDSDKRYIVKKITLPASQVQVEALLGAGIYQDAQAVDTYYRELACAVREEVRILDQLAGQRGFVPYQGCQIEPLEDGIGYEVQLLSRYRTSLERHIRHTRMTHLGAVNLGIDLCAALALSREAGWLYVDLKPENIFLFGDQEYRIGDLGFVSMDSLAYASLPDRYRSLYTAPEVCDAFARLNPTMDTYALGLVLYQIYNNGWLPFLDADERKRWQEKLAAGEPMTPPAGADPEMAEIICKACAPDPADRWQTPAQMGHALISYMQRIGADDIPIEPIEKPQAEEPEPEAEPIEEAVIEVEEEQENTEAPLLTEEPAEEASPEPAEEPVPEPETPEEEKPAPAVPAPRVRKPWFRSFFKKLLRRLFSLALVAALVFGAWYYYQNYYLQPIDEMVCKGSGNQVSVFVTTALDESKLTVICKDTYGNAVKGTLADGAVTFSDLLPGSQYIITLEAEGFCQLTGTTSVTYSTPAETKIMHMAAITAHESGSAIISFGVEGQDPGQWILTMETEGEEPKTVEFSGHSVTVTGLTVGAEYTFTLMGVGDVLQVGENVLTHVACDLIQARNLAFSAYEDGALTMVWDAPESASVGRWFVRCTSADGYDQSLETTDPTATFTGLTAGTRYTVEVIAENMTLGVRTDIVADANNISGFAGNLEGSTITLTWDYGGAVPEGGWNILWSADGGDEQLLTATENTATLSPAAPGTTYTFTIQPPRGTSLQSATCTVTVPRAGAFQSGGLKLENVAVAVYAIPAEEPWDHLTLAEAEKTNSFAPGGSLVLLYTASVPVEADDTEHETLFVIRNSQGSLVSATSRTRTWAESWTDGFCTEIVNNLPTVRGSYTLSVYVDGGALAIMPFFIQ